MTVDGAPLEPGDLERKVAAAHEADADCTHVGFSGEGRCIEPAIEDGLCRAHRRPFKVGEWADHVSGDLDPREVGAVQGDKIRLRIHSIMTDWVPAANYDRIPREG